MKCTSVNQALKSNKNQFKRVVSFRVGQKLVTGPNHPAHLARTMSGRFTRAKRVKGIGLCWFGVVGFEWGELAQQNPLSTDLYT